MGRSFCFIDDTNTAHLEKLSTTKAEKRQILLSLLT